MKRTAWTFDSAPNSVVHAAHRRELDLERLLRPVAVADTISIGRGAIVAAISTLLVSTRRPGHVLAQATALHVERDHVDGHRDRHATIDRAEQERLRAAAGLPGHAEAVAADVGQRLEKVERADRVPELQAAETQAPQVLARPPNVCGSCRLSL